VLYLACYHFDTVYSMFVHITFVMMSIDIKKNIYGKK